MHQMQNAISLRTLMLLYWEVTIVLFSANHICRWGRTRTLALIPAVSVTRMTNISVLVDPVER